MFELTDYTFRVVLIGTILIGFVIGSFGTFAVQRQESLLGDAISHSTFAGITIGFLITFDKDLLTLMVFATISGLLSSLMVYVVSRYSKTKKEAALGISLTTFFGLGVFMLGFIQKSKQSSQSGLDKFLFGNAATLLESDVVVIAVVTLAIILFTELVWKELKLVTFDRLQARIHGFPTKALEVVLLLNLTVVIVVGLKAVGVVLISSLVVGPAVAARHWTGDFRRVYYLAGCIGAVSGVFGTIISSSGENLPTGPFVVVVLSLFVFGSLLLSPSRGLIKAYVTQRAIKGTTT